MLAACWIAFGLFQTQIDSVRRIEIAQAAVAAQASATERANSARTDEERRRFEEQLNRLAVALTDFQREYSASGGQVWPKKQAETLKKAIQALHLR